MYIRTFAIVFRMANSSLIPLLLPLLAASFLWHSISNIFPTCSLQTSRQISGSPIKISLTNTAIAGIPTDVDKNLFNSENNL